LASELPHELRVTVLQRPAHQPFTLEEFFHRVGAREGIRWHQAVAHARAVIAVVSIAVSAGEIKDVRMDLTSDYDALCEAATEV
jgi:uncharacterized protein (DUF2267 family)